MNTQTLEQMKHLRFYGMYRAFNDTLQANTIDYTNDELIAYLMQFEWDDRYNRKIDRLTKAAKFRYKAILENINYSPSRNIDKNQIQRFTACVENSDKVNHPCRIKLSSVNEVLKIVSFVV